MQSAEIQVKSYLYKNVIGKLVLPNKKKTLIYFQFRACYMHSIVLKESRISWTQSRVVRCLRHIAATTTMAVESFFYFQRAKYLEAMLRSWWRRACNLIMYAFQSICLGAHTAPSTKAILLFRSTVLHSFIEFFRSWQSWEAHNAHTIRKFRDILCIISWCFLSPYLFCYPAGNSAHI